MPDITRKSAGRPYRWAWFLALYLASLAVMAAVVWGLRALVF